MQPRSEEGRVGDSRHTHAFSAMHSKGASSVAKAAAASGSIFVGARGSADPGAHVMTCGVSGVTYGAGVKPHGLCRRRHT